MPSLVDYEIGRKLGEGAFGDVHAAFDKSRRAHVALKRLRSPSSSTVYRFRNEFRSLADIFHPNLVTLYDLFPDESDWYISMELVDGSDIVSYARRAVFALADTMRVSAAAGGDPYETLRVDGPPTLDVERIRATFSQLASGVRALHAARKLHRDLKPSNVLVAADGTVKILDFGLVTELVHASRSLADIVGTPAYMAPEQTRGEGVTEASDWYAVGAILYETLTGRPPFEETDFLALMSAKNDREVADPRLLDGSLPESLCNLSLQLLRRDAAARPDAASVEVALQRVPSSRPQPLSAASSARLVGRERQLASLADAFGESRAGATVVAHVVGTSGSGKTSLVRELLREASEHSDVIVLEGRCYEGESAPFKAVDTVMSATAARLARAEPAFLEAVIPRDFPLLTRIFPVLQRLPVARRSSSLHIDVHDPVQIRRRGFAALRDMVGRIAERRPVVVFIDDLQWGDLDSVALLTEVVRAPDAPAFLLLLSYRAEDVHKSEVLRAVRDRVVADRNIVIDVAPLGRDDCSTLARTLLAASGRVAEGDLQAIINESGGNPFFVHELARLATHDARSTEDVSVDRLISDRLLRGNSTARSFAQVVSLAASGMSLESVAEVLGLPGEAALAALSFLRNERVVRTRRDGERDVIEMYHDKIRERVRDVIEPAHVRELHGRIAEALEQSDADPETLVFHFNASETPAAALVYAERAATAAANALAFDRATQLRRLILDLTETGTEQHGEALVSLADALTRAGQGGEAADLYEAAAAVLGEVREMELLRRATEQLLVVGEIERGLTLLNRVLASEGLSLVGPLHSLVLIVGMRVWLRIRGTEPRPTKDAARIHKLTARFDICNSAALGLVMIHNAHSSVFVTRLLRVALRLDDKFRLTRALVGQSVFQSMMARSKHQRDRARALLEAARSLAAEVRSSGCDAFLHLGEAILSLGAGEWASGLAAAARSIAEYGAQAVPLSTTRREVQVSETVSMMAEFYAGSLRDLSARRERLQRDAIERGDLFLHVTSGIGFATIADLTKDDPKSASESLDFAMKYWPKSPYTQQRHFALLGRTMVSLYSGDDGHALANMELEWPVLKKSGALYSTTTFVLLTRYLRAIAHLNAIPTGGFAHRRIALREAIAIERRADPWTLPFAAVIRAAAASAGGRHDLAVDLLRSAALELKARSMISFEAAARFRLGALLGGDGGHEMTAQAERDLEAIGVRNPSRFVQALMPRFTP